MRVYTYKYTKLQIPVHEKKNQKSKIDLLVTYYISMYEFVSAVDAREKRFEQQHSASGTYQWLAEYDTPFAVGSAGAYVVVAEKSSRKRNSIAKYTSAVRRARTTDGAGPFRRSGSRAESAKENLRTRQPPLKRQNRRTLRHRPSPKIMSTRVRRVSPAPKSRPPLTRVPLMHDGVA